MIVHTCVIRFSKIYDLSNLISIAKLKIFLINHNDFQMMFPLGPVSIRNIDCLMSYSKANDSRVSKSYNTERYLRL